MRKTIFILALFTVILSYSISKAELFLEDVELAEFEEEELAAKGGTTGKTSGAALKKDTTTDAGKTGETAGAATTKPATTTTATTKPATKKPDTTTTKAPTPTCTESKISKYVDDKAKKGAKKSSTWTVTVTRKCTGPTKGDSSVSVTSVTCPIAMKKEVGKEDVS